VLPFHGNNGP